MRIFLSYASEERNLAEQVSLALVGSGYDVFFDRESLPPAGDYNSRIRTAVERSDILIFLISTNSVLPGSYALTELKYARKKWPHPKSHVLPVMVKSVSWEIIPSYLKAVTVLEPEGNLSAEVLEAVSVIKAEAIHEEQATANLENPGTPNIFSSPKKLQNHWDFVFTLGSTFFVSLLVWLVVALTDSPFTMRETIIVLGICALSMFGAKSVLSYIRRRTRGTKL